jgi:arginyl-tRNA synthetase
MRTKKLLRDVLSTSAQTAKAKGELAFETLPAFEIETPKLAEHGDFASNIAMLMASQAKRPPRQIAEILKQNLSPPEGLLAGVEIAGPGFVNFFIEDSYWFGVLPEIHKLGPAYGISDLGAGKKVQVEFVSANPTGPLHIGHGRGAGGARILHQ